MILGRRHKPAQSPSLASQGNSLLWVIATLLLAAIPQLLLMPWPLVLACSLPVAWRVFAHFKQLPPLPAWLRYLAVGLALISLAVAYGGLFGRRASVSLLTVMLALKLLECHRIRDARLVVSFSFFLCTTQFLFTQGLIMPLYGAATVLAGLVALAQLHREEAFSRKPAAPTTAAPVLAELGFSLRLLLLALPVCLAFFILFPRWGSPLWGVPETTLDARSGLSDNMSPGSIENLFMDDSTAFRVEFIGPVPRQSELYWRGPVFWNYDGKTWSSSFYGRNIVAPSLPQETEDSWRYRVQLEPNERNWLFALDYPTAAPRDARISMDFQLLQRQAVTQLTQYQMVSNPDFSDSPKLQKTIRDIALELPVDMNPRTRQLIKQWRMEFPDDAALIRQALQWFNQEPFHYALNAPLLGYHAIDSFLFDTRTGYCEHYASAFTVMMRMAGIPTRIVTGYQGGWYNPEADYFLIRQSDAHAWSEVWLPESGWTRIDPTAAVSPLRVERGSLDAIDEPRHLLDFDWIRSLRNSLDSMEKRWNTWVIDYNFQRQSQLFAGLGMDQMRPLGLVSLLFAVLGVLAVILLPILWRTRGPGSRDPAQLIWQKFLKRLQRAGYRSQPSQGARELATAAAVKLPEQAENIIHISDLYNRYRYSQESPGIRALREAVRAFKPKRSA
jgi:transglutaminase-like putative cysteine protease